MYTIILLDADANFLVSFPISDRLSNAQVFQLYQRENIGGIIQVDPNSTAQDIYLEEIEWAPGYSEMVSASVVRSPISHRSSYENAIASLGELEEALEQ